MEITTKESKFGWLLMDDGNGRTTKRTVYVERRLDLCEAFKAKALENAPTIAFIYSEAKDLTDFIGLMKDEGFSHSLIAMELNRRGFKDSKGRVWCPMSVKKYKTQKPAAELKAAA